MKKVPFANISDDDLARLVGISPRVNIPVLGLTISSITPTAMRYLYKML
jgi:hypothetical protein